MDTAYTWLTLLPHHSPCEQIVPCLDLERIHEDVKFIHGRRFTTLAKRTTIEDTTSVVSGLNAINNLDRETSFDFR